MNRIAARWCHVEEPHTAIDGTQQGKIINLTDRRAEASRRGQLDLLHSLGPEGITREVTALKSAAANRQVPVAAPQLVLPHLIMPSHHGVRPSDVLQPRLHASLTAAANRGPADFAELFLVCTCPRLDGGIVRF